MKTDEHADTIAHGSRVAITNVLCGVDLGAGSGQVLEYGIAIAGTYGANLYLAHVVPDLNDLLAQPGTAAEEQPQIIEKAKVDLSYLAYRHGARPGHSHLLVNQGDPAETLLRWARQYAADFIVLGTHGRRGWHRVAMGSVAEQVFRQVACPVLTVSPRAQARPLTFPLRQLLFPTDFSHESRSALPYVFSLAQEHKAKLTLIHLIHPDIQSAEERQRIRESYTAKLRELISEEPFSSVDVRCVVEFDLVPEGIMRVAAETHTDMIILGVRGMGAFAALESHLPGPIAYGVIADAPCAVLTIRSSLDLI